MIQNTPNFKNAKYSKHESQVHIVNDVYDGVDTASRHLQQYKKEESSDYKNRQHACTLNNYVFRVVNSFKDIIFRQALTVETSNATIESILEDVDFTQDVNSFAKELTVATKRDGYAFILVDAPVYDNVESRADEIDRGLRPYWSLIERKRVINWKTNIKGDFTLVTIEETYTTDSGTFGEETATQQRVFFEDGRVQIWRDGEFYSEIQTGLDYIPLVKVDKQDIPPMYDLCKLNVNHMNRQSELNSYVRIAGAPIPISWGLNGQEGVTTVIGVNQGINFSATPAEADFQWREMSGANATVIREQIKADEEAMLDIAISLVTSNQPRTATEVNSDNMENESKLVDTAVTVEQGLNRALEITKEFLNITSEDEIKLNRDFDSNKLTPQEIAEYRNDYINNIIDLDTLWNVLIAGEVYPAMDEAQRNKIKANLVDNGAI